MEKKYNGSCHCGAVKFDVDLSLDRTITCNCSMCQRAGTILAFVPSDKFNLISGSDVLKSYHFNKKVIDHLFCSICGIKPFARGRGENGIETIAVNVRCLEGVELGELNSQSYNGRES